MHQRIQQIKKRNCLRCGRQFKPSKQSGAAGWILNLGRCKCDKPELSIYAEIYAEGDLHEGSSGSQANSSGIQTTLDLPTEIDGRYEVLEQIGKGGMGAVYKVRDIELDQIFAIKTLHQNLARDSSLLKRFELEAEAISGLDHPGVVNVYRHGLTGEGEPYLVMDYSTGETLAELIEREGALPEQRALRILLQIAEAVVHAHDRGIIHRDIKPANIIVSTGLDGEDVVKVLDFGIAKTLPGVDRETRDMTQTGEVFGSPHYMSPEQCLGFMLDQRSDIYSFGCLMYEVLSGKPPFAGSNPIQLLVKHINEQPKPIPGKLVRTPKMKSLQAIAMMCLEKEQIDRFQSISEIVAELKRVQEGKKFSELGASKLKRSVAMSQMTMISMIVPSVVLIFWASSLRLPQVSFGLSGEQLGSVFTLTFCAVLIFCIWGFLKNVSNCSKLAREGLANERTWWLAHSFFFSAGMPLSILTLFLIIISAPALVSFSLASGLGLLHCLDYVVAAAFLLFATGIIVACICPFGPMFDFKSKKVRYSLVSRKLAALFSVVLVALIMLYPKQISSYVGTMAGIAGILPAPLSSGLDRSLVNLALRFNPGDTFLLEVRTTINNHRGYIDEAIADCTTLIAGSSRDESKLSSAYRRRACLYAEKGDYKLAIQDLSREIKVDPYWRAYRLRGICLRNSGDLQGALADFDKAEELSSGEASVLVQKAYALALTGDSTQAVAILDKVDKQSWTRTDTEICYLRGLIYRECGLDLKARDSFEQAAGQKLQELYFGASRVRVARGLARLELGRTAEALSDLRVDLMISAVDLRYDLSVFPPEIQKKVQDLLSHHRL